MDLSRLPCGEVLRTLKEPFVLVGGGVRDLLIGHAPLDVDVVPLQSPPDVFARRLAARLRRRVVTLSEEHREYRVPCGRGWVDVAGLRASTLREDLRRRDFTVNAIALRMPEGRCVDPWGGREDLRRRMLRTPRLRNLQDDPLRILRGLRLVAQLGFWVEPRTLAAMVRFAPELPRVAPERIRMELLRLAEGDFADRAFRLGFEAGVLDPLLPEVAALREVPDVDVLDHTLTALHYLVQDLTFPHRAPWAPFAVRPVPRALIVLGALFHDLGKKDTYSRDEKGIHFYGHDRLGARMVRRRLEALRFSRDEQDWLSRFVERHMYPHLLAHSHDRTPRAVARFIRKTGELLFPLLYFAVEDARASPHVGGGIRDHLQLFRDVMEILEASEKRPVRLITGHDLLALGYPRGPLYRKILTEVEERAMAGELTTREEALAWVRAHYPLEGLDD